MNIKGTSCQNHNKMRLHDTLSGARQKLDMGKKIRIYLCGVTVYDEAHIGHARTIVVFDVLQRHLQYMGAQVQFVQNFTDVDDKIIQRAGEGGTTAEELSEGYIKSYFEDFDRLGVGRADSYPKATQHIADIILFISELIQKGMAYTAKNGVYFAVSKFPGYGKLSGKKTDELQAGARVEEDKTKNDPLDFALWKLADDKPAWDSPWGRGRPGWHIECSAMSARYLGDEFEIHGGGRDLIFPHHENEIAQSESAGKPFAKLWMHVGMVTIQGQKMSKSLGNIKTVKMILNDWGPNVARLFCLSAHYSKPIDYSQELLDECLAKWRQAEACYFELLHAKKSGPTGNMGATRQTKFDDALKDDFNTHGALQVFFNLVKDVNKMAAGNTLDDADTTPSMEEFQRMSGILGLCVPGITAGQKEEIDHLIEARKELRKNKEFARADQIRDKINAMNVELLDHDGKTVWIKREHIRADSQVRTR